jgi:arginyl-tRNA synthetase
LLGGNDIMRKAEQHMDFDLDLAKSKTNENPVFYIQYAHQIGKLHQ